jgi:hypothetical protein
MSETKLPMGTRVIIRVPSYPEEKGVIVGIGKRSNCYRVKFDRLKSVYVISPTFITPEKYENHPKGQP